MIHSVKGLVFVAALGALWLPQFAGAANPAPRATQRPGIVAQRAGGAKAVTLNPAAVAAEDSTHSEGPTYFALERQGPGAALAFHSSDPHLKLATQTGFLIQITAPEGIEVSPKLLNGSDWPAGKLELPVQIRGKAKAYSPWIHGAAAYLVCDDRIADAAKRCRRMSGAFAFRP